MLKLKLRRLVPKPISEKTERIFHLFYRVTDKDSKILSAFHYPNHLAMSYVVTGVSQSALPTQEEMEGIVKACPCIFFPPGIKLGLGGTQKTVDLKDVVERAERNGNKIHIIYVDPESELFWNGKPVYFTEEEKLVRITIVNGELDYVQKLLHRTPEMSH